MMSANKLDFDLVDQLLSYTEFKLPWDFELEKLIQKVENLSVEVEMGDKLTQYLNSKNLPNNSWVSYLSTSEDYVEQVRLHQKSADLGNPFAMLQCAEAEDLLDEKEREKYLKSAVDLGYPKAIYSYILFYLAGKENIDDIDLWLQTKDWNIEQKDQLRDRVLEDIKKFPVDLQLTDRIHLSLEQHVIYGYIADLFYHLNDMYKDGRYSTEVTYYMLCSNMTQREFTQIYSGIVYDVIISENFIRKIEYEKLKKSYEELKKVKAMDFNSIVSNGVGDFLN